MLIYPHFNPIAFHIGPVPVHWYGLMYLFGFMAVYALGRYRAKKPWTALNTKEEVMDAIFYGALGVIIGGRVGYMLFYDLPNFLVAPWSIVEIWKGGMSFHGGLIGVTVAFWWYSRKLKKHIFDLTDFFAPMVPIGLAFGRFGNFINGELFGRVTNSPIGMIFPNGGPLPRYPSQLIELSLEGIVLFILLWLYSSKPRPRMAVSGWFLIGYSLCRFIDEFFRQPDPQLGFIAFGWLTMGQLLCVPMFIIGLILLRLTKKRS